MPLEDHVILTIDQFERIMAIVNSVERIGGTSVLFAGLNRRSGVASGMGARRVRGGRGGAPTIPAFVTATQVGGDGVVQHAWEFARWDEDEGEFAGDSTAFGSSIGSDQYARFAVNAIAPGTAIGVGTFVLIRQAADSVGNTVFYIDPPTTAGLVAYPAKITFVSGTDPPWQYSFSENRPKTDGTGYEAFVGSRNQDDYTPAYARNRVELRLGFGTTTGPYGLPLTFTNPDAEYEIRKIATGSYVLIVEEFDADGGPHPRFDAYNPLVPACTA
jgi:hypothetical protein